MHSKNRGAVSERGAYDGGMVKKGSNGGSRDFACNRTVNGLRGSADRAGAGNRVEF